MKLINNKCTIILLISSIFIINPAYAEKKSSLKKLIDFGIGAVVNYGIQEAIDYTLEEETATTKIAASTRQSSVDIEEVQTVLSNNSRSEQERAELAEATLSILQYYENIRRRNATVVQATWLDPFSDIAVRARDLTEKFGAKCDVNDGNKVEHQSGRITLAIEVVCYEAKKNVTYQIKYSLRKVGDDWKIAASDGKRINEADGWYRVVAEPYLNVRNSPELNARSIGKVDNDSRVKIMGRNGGQRQISGRNGYWAKIEYQEISGWVFDAWLERVY